MPKRDAFAESEFLPPRRGEPLRLASYKLPVPLIESLGQVAEAQGRPIVAVVRAALARAIAAHRNNVLSDRTKEPMMTVAVAEELAALERVLREGGGENIPLADRTRPSGLSSFFKSALGLDQVFPVSIVFAEQDEPFAIYSRDRADGVRELGPQTLQSDECSVQVGGMNSLPPFLPSKDLCDHRHAHAAYPLLEDLGDRLRSFAVRQVLADQRCRGRVGHRRVKTSEVVGSLETEVGMVAQGGLAPPLAEPVVLLSVSAYRALAADFRGRSPRSGLERLERIPARVSGFHAIPEGTALVLRSEVVIGLIPRIRVWRSGDSAKLTLAADAYLQDGVVVEVSRESEPA